jgi:hypothetical protein
MLSTLSIHLLRQGKSDGAGPLCLVAFGRPLQEALEPRVLAPYQREKFARAQVVHVPAEECFQAPPEVGAGPRSQPVTLGGDPVVAESVEHLDFFLRQEFRQLVSER